MGLFKTLDELLESYQSFDESESASINSLRQFLDMSNNPYDRNNLFAHTVCNAWVVSPDRKQVLLLVHGESGDWMAPGGHADGSADMIGVARRELLEETGVSPDQTKTLLGGGLFDVNTGIVPERIKPHGLEPAHLHFDLCFAFEADPKSINLQISNESRDLAWKPVEQALDMMMACHRRRAQKTIKGVLL